MLAPRFTAHISLAAGANWIPGGRRNSKGYAVRPKLYTSDQSAKKRIKQTRRRHGRGAHPPPTMRCHECSCFTPCCPTMPRQGLRRDSALNDSGIESQRVCAYVESSGLQAPSTTLSPSLLPTEARGRQFHQVRLAFGSRAQCPRAVSGKYNVR